MQWPWQCTLKQHDKQQSYTIHYNSFNRVLFPESSRMVVRLRVEVELFFGAFRITPWCDGYWNNSQTILERPQMMPWTGDVVRWSWSPSNRWTHRICCFLAAAKFRHYSRLAVAVQRMQGNLTESKAVLISFLLRRSNHGCVDGMAPCMTLFCTSRWFYTSRMISGSVPLNVGFAWFRRCLKCQPTVGALSCRSLLGS